MKRTLLAAAAAIGVIAGASPAEAGTDPCLGEITAVGCTFCPPGWVEASGQVLSIQRNSALFSLCGTTFGGEQPIRSP